MTPSHSTSTAHNPTWESRYEQLLQWRAQRGDTCVPKAEGALGRWVARQRELKRTGKLDPAREEALNAISFVWNTVTAMWEERFRRLNEWKKIHGHCAVPIAEGELGTWVSKQRQLRKRGKLSKEKIIALDSLNFTWSTAEADWEDKFKRLCEWTRQRGHASVPFNEGELGWWVNTQRQCKRKGKLSPSREARLQSLGFVWNPSNSRSRNSNSSNAPTAVSVGGATSTTINAMSSAVSSIDNTPTSTPEKCDRLFSTIDDDANDILNLFTTAEHPPQLPDVKAGHDIFQDAPSPVSAVAEHLSTDITTPLPTICEPLVSPPPALLSANLWSPTIMSSPMPTGSCALSMPLGLHLPPVTLDVSCGQMAMSNSFYGQSDVLEQLLARDDVGILDVSAIDSLTCHEEL